MYEINYEPLSQAALKELSENPEKLGEFATTALAMTIHKGLMITQEATTTGPLVTFAEMLRKVRENVVGKAAESHSPSMTVNISFGEQHEPRLVNGIVGTPPRISAVANIGKTD